MPTERIEYIGIDGCPAGWVCIGLGPGAVWQAEVVRSTDRLADLATGAQLTLIDVPIGLLDSGREERVCDREARRVLGPPRASSVFPAPARGTLSAKTYEAASELNHELTGRRLSRQSWAIAPKIREIDQLLRERADLRGKLRECHPEVCFWALNGMRPMQYNKRTADGRNERLTLLSQHLPMVDMIVNEVAGAWRRGEVAWDDIIDALVATVTAKLGYGKLMTLPEKPPVDECGLAMEMVTARMG